MEIRFAAVACLVNISKNDDQRLLSGSAMKNLLSVITPCYNEEASIVRCYEAVRDILASELPNYDYEHIFADNASQDRTLALLCEIAKNDPRAKIIVNARNFGPMRSHFNALLSASGDVIAVFVPADLQDPPELIPQFVHLWEQGHEVVYGIRAERDESLIMRALRSIFYWLVSRNSSFKIPRNVGDFQLIDKKVLQTLRLFRDQYPYVRGMIFYCGFRAVGVPYKWRRRQQGKTKNSLLNLIDQALNGWLTFSNLPLRLAMFVGIILAAASILYGLILLGVYFLTSVPLAEPGVTTIMLALFIFSGFQLFFLGLLGEYIGSINSHTRRHPRVVERERINFSVRGDSTH